MIRASARILVVDDERPIRRYLKAALHSQGYEVLEAGTAAEALGSIPTAHPDLIILDLGLPDQDGMEVTRQIRAWSEVPIIILSVRDHEHEKVKALDAGADDYLTKPFSTGELLARLRVALRRIAVQAGTPIYRQDALEIDWSRRNVFMQGHEVSLTQMEFELLKTLVQQAGKVMTHARLLQAVWGPGYEHEIHLLRVTMSNLRRKIEPDPTRPHYILTEPGVGYRLRADGWTG